MLPLIYAILWLLSILLVIPVYSQELPMNATTELHKLQHLTSRAPAIGPAHILCSDAAKFPGNSHVNWEPCISLFFKILMHEKDHFLSDLLWAPNGWHTTVLADKQCPRQWHQGPKAHSLRRETVERMTRADQRRQKGAILSSTARARRP